MFTNDSFNDTVDAMVKQLKAMAHRDDLFDSAAQLMRKSYEALIRAGFTEQQAIEIVSRQGSGIKS